MTGLGSRLIKSAQEALAYSTGETTAGFIVHKTIDVKAIRAKRQLAQLSNDSSTVCGSGA
jgi:hypothetical protein